MYDLEKYYLGKLSEEICCDPNFKLLNFVLGLYFISISNDSITIHIQNDM